MWFIGFLFSVNVVYNSYDGAVMVEQFVNAFPIDRDEQSEIDVASGFYFLFGSGKVHFLNSFGLELCLVKG